ncbi:MAG: YlmC/YmxH family sporulation protein [Oscillospiraceae bacterium]|nr:YlmC/YmxH family sporulation protein [Oscillospiraceae bacterium]
MTHTTITDLRYKEIINLQNGNRLGFVYDAEITMPEGQVTALIVPGPARFFGLFGRGEDMVIPWEKISKIGADIILVEIDGEPRRHAKAKKGRFF